MATTARADDAKPTDGPKPPVVMLVAPPAAAPGEKVTVRLRGTALDDASEVKLSGDSGAKVDVKNKGKAEGDDAVKKRVGETQVEVEFTVPPDAPAGDDLKLIVVTSKGESAQAGLRIVPKEQLVSEAEPNGGLRQSQPVAADRCIVRGTIGEEKDVDAFRVSGKAGQTLHADVVAAARGSAVDATLTIYDGRGKILASADDTPGSAAPRDPSVDYRFSADGDVFVVVTDANDKGGPQAYPYLLNLSKQ